MSRQGTGKSATISKAFALTSNWSAILALSAVSVAAIQLKSSTGQAPKMQDARITVRYTDIRQSAGITFRQDSTQTDEKYYLETMGTGVGWIDYDQDGLMDLYFVQSAATDIYKPPRPLRSTLYHNNGDGTFTDVTEKAGVGGEGHYGQGVAVGDYGNDYDDREGVSSSTSKIADPPNTYFTSLRTGFTPSKSGRSVSSDSQTEYQVPHSSSAPTVMLNTLC